MEKIKAVKEYEVKVTFHNFKNKINNVTFLGFIKKKIPCGYQNAS